MSLVIPVSSSVIGLTRLQIDTKTEYRKLSIFNCSWYKAFSNQSDHPHVDIISLTLLLWKVHDDQPTKIQWYLLCYNWSNSLCLDKSGKHRISNKYKP